MEWLEARHRRYQRMGASGAESAGSGRSGSRRGPPDALPTSAGTCSTRPVGRLTDAAGTVVVEDLNTQAMTVSAKGTAKKPGARVRRKAVLNRVILRTGWAESRRMLEYKADRVIVVDPAYTSQTCAVCETVDRHSRRSRTVFVLSAWPAAMRRTPSLNAAANIRRRGLTHLHGEGVAVGLPVKSIAEPSDVTLRHKPQTQ